MVLQTNSYNFCRCSVIPHRPDASDDKPGNGKAPLQEVAGDAEAGTGEPERWLVALAGSNPATVELWEVIGLVRLRPLQKVALNTYMNLKFKS